ncbi:MAG: dTDP-4-dehydrorhamnose reductase [Leeuwenhoekiella sp.]
MKRILITGGNGQLAANLKVLAKDHRQTIVMDFKSAQEMDITNSASVLKAFAEKKYDYCINCAAYTQVDKAENEQELAQNINERGAKNLAEACRNSGSILVHISTDFVFDGNQSEPYSETDVPNPTGKYGQTKLQGEKAIEATMVKFFIIRTSWLYSEYGHNFMKSMLKYGRERDELTVVFDQVGTPTYAGDLALAILRIIASGSTAYGTYHYSNEGVASWYDFASAIFDLADIKVELLPIRSEKYPLPAPRPAFSVFDKSKIKEEFQLKIPHWRQSLAKALNRNPGIANH